MITFRHTGKVVKDLEEAKKPYLAMGFREVNREHIEVLKLQDVSGNTIELLQGNWSDHIAVNLYRTEDGQLFEVVEHLKEDKK